MFLAVAKASPDEIASVGVCSRKFSQQEVIVIAPITNNIKIIFFNIVIMLLIIDLLE